MRFVTLFPYTENVHLHKDVGSIPAVLARDFGWDAELVTLQNEDKYEVDSIGKFLKIRTLPKFSKKIYSLPNLISCIVYLITESRKIDVLNLYHFTKFNTALVLIYKFLNKRGKVYIKFDINENNLTDEYLTDLEKFYWSKVLLRAISFASVETSKSYNILVNSFFKENANKIMLLNNGFDDSNANALGINLLHTDKKEKIMSTVGRIGMFEKNNELLIDALKFVDLKEWSVFFIGPIENNFKEKSIAQLKKHNPDIVNKIHFVGAVNDKKTLFEYYNRAKIFCLTSRSEGYPLVLPEALFFGNYIISTPIGASIDITQNNQIGAIIENEKDLSNKINEIICNEQILDDNFIKARAYFDLKFSWTSICFQINQKIQNC